MCNGFFDFFSMHFHRKRQAGEKGRKKTAARGGCFVLRCGHCYGGAGFGGFGDFSDLGDIFGDFFGGGRSRASAQTAMQVTRLL